MIQSANKNINLDKPEIINDFMVELLTRIETIIDKSEELIMSVGKWGKFWIKVDYKRKGSK